LSFIADKGVLVFLFAAAAASAATISVQPSAVATPAGQLVNLDIHVDSVTDLYGWNFDINFDPSILQAISVTEGDFLDSGGSTFFIPGDIDNVGGDISFNADSLESAVPGVTGSGGLAEVQFMAIAPGMSPVDLVNLSLLDSQLNPIDADIANGAVTVVTATPEPAGWSLMLACLGLVSGLIARRRAAAALAVAAVAVCNMLTAPAVAADISTAQMDSSRTMANGSEIYLTTSNVNASLFGKLFARPVDGAIYAQPLYLQGVVVAGRKLNIVYTATSHDNVYAFDADNPAASTPIWSLNLGNYDTPSGWNTGLGILSTPLIVRASNTLFVTAATRENGSRVYRLHALNLLTGVENPGSPVVISGSVPGNAGDSVNGIVTFDANDHLQRTGLALSGNNVVLAFAPDRDHAPYHGWVFSYDIGTLQQTGIFNDARNNALDNGTGAGIWQSGRAPAVDAHGVIYLETGNGDYDGTSDFGESFLKLTPGAGGMTLTDWFTPSNFQALNDVDYDLGSTGPTLIPGSNLMFGGSKSGTIYLLSTSNLGRLSSGDAGLVQSFTATTGCVIPFVGQGCTQIMGHAFWSTAAVPTLYVWGVHDVLRAYQFGNGVFNTVPSGVGTEQAYYPGGVLSVSSYLGTGGTGILWAITEDAPDNGNYFGPSFTGTATLHAFDANNVATELWNSNQNPLRDEPGTFASFAPPVAVNGKVYVPTFSGQLVVYGLVNGVVPGDVSGDSVVNCTDLAIVKASYGKSSSQPGFDLRADVNGDGIVNLVDLSTVSRQLPAGTVCH
jgi:Cohesin domain/Dockerin type I domain